MIAVRQDGVRQQVRKELVIKEPAAESDLEKLLEFFTALPLKTRNYLRYDVTDVAACRARLDQLDGRDHWRLIAEIDGKIVGDATMDREPFGWTRHVAEVRAIVFPSYLHLGIGPALFSELAEIGTKSGIEILFTEVMVEQTDLILALEQSGFVKEAVRRNYAKDLGGKVHDVIIMSNNLEEVWSHLADMVDETDMKVIREG